MSLAILHLRDYNENKNTVVTLVCQMVCACLCMCVLTVTLILQVSLNCRSRYGDLYHCCGKATDHWKMTEQALVSFQGKPFHFSDYKKLCYTSD